MTKSQNKTELIIFIICIIAVLIAVFYLTFVQKDLKKEEQENTVVEEETENFDLEEAKSILNKIEYPIIMDSTNQYNNKLFYYMKSRTIDDLSDKAKFLIAIKNAIPIADCSDYDCYIEEDKVIDIYTSLFNQPYTYINNSYTTKEGNAIRINSNWKENNNGKVYTKIESATTYDEKLEIVVKVAFEYNSTLFQDYELTSVLQTKSKIKSEDDLDKLKDLYEYKFTFKYNKDSESYIYVSTKKIST